MIFIASVGKMVVFSATIYCSDVLAKTSSLCFCVEEAPGVSGGLRSRYFEGEARAAA